ncbi:MAG: helix-turn-helix transcriptional regulator [Eubacteriales bacterium]|nr:helix-turn-helix transcriptional regulator [Eubacteriales bacterium]
MIDYNALGCQIRELRKKCGYSQEQLAELCDISTSFLGHIERGTRKMSLETLISLSNALHVTPDVILQNQITLTDSTIGSFLSSLTFDSESQKQQFYRSIRALAKGRTEL